MTAVTTKTRPSRSRAGRSVSTHRRGTGQMAPNWPADPAERSEATGFWRLGASARAACVVDFVQKHPGGVAGEVKWEMSAK